MANDNSQNRVAASISIDTSKLRESLQQANQAVKEFRDQLNQSSGNTFIQSADGAVRNLQQAIRELQLQFKEGTIAADELVTKLQTLRQTYASALDTKTPIGVINDQALRNAIVQAQNILTRYYDFRFTSEKRLAEQEQQAKEAAIENELRIIKERYSVQLDTAQTTLQKLKKLMDEESAYFEANELKKIEAIKLMNKAQTDIAEKQSANLLQRGTVMSALGNFDTGLSTAKMMAQIGVIMGLASAWNTLVEGIKTVEDGAAGLQQVFENQIHSQDQLNKVTNDFIGIAQKYGVSVQEVLDNAKLIGRQYKDINEALTITNSTMLLSVVDNVDLTTATRGLEATLNSMGMAAKNQAEAFANSMRVVDAWSNLSHNSAVSATDLVTAVERAGGAAHAAGVSFDQLNALVTSAVRNTGMSGENIGNMLKTLFSTIRTDKAQEALKQLNISLTETGQNGQKVFRPVFDVLLELSQKLQTTNVSQQKLLTTISGGVYQYSKVAAMLTDYKTIIDAYALSINSAGKAQEYAQVQMNTLSRDIQRLKDTFVQLAAQTDNNGLGKFLKDIVSGLNSLLLGLEQMPPATGQVLLGIGGLIVGLQAFSAIMSALEPLAAGLIVAFRGLTPAMEAATVATEAETAATAGLSAAFTTLDVVSGGLALAIGAVVAGISAYAMKQGEAAQAAQQQAQITQSQVGMAQQELTLAQQKQQFVETAIKQEQQLKKALEDTNLSAENRNKILNDLVALYQSVGKATGDEALKQVNASNIKNHSLDTERKAMANLVDAKQKAYENAVEANKKEVQNDIDATNQKIENVNKTIAALKAETEAKMTQMSFWENAQYIMYRVAAGFSAMSGDPSLTKYYEDQAAAVAKGARDRLLGEVEAEFNQLQAKLADDQYKLASLNLEQFKIDTTPTEQIPPPDTGGDGSGGSGGSGGGSGSSARSTGFTGPYSNLINQAAEQYGIDPNFLAAVLMEESGLNPYNANGTIKVSPAGAIGIAQFMPGTARALGVNPYDTTSSIYGAAKYLKNLLNQFGSMDLAAAAYNAGAGNVQKYGGIPPFAETQNYVKAVDAYYRQFSNGQSLSGGSFTSQFTDQYKDYVDQLERSLNPLIQRNKELDATISNLTTQQQNFADLLKYGATNADIASQSTDVYTNKLKALHDGQTSLHETNNAIRADMAQIQQKIHELNPNNAPLSSLSQGTSEAIQTLQQEYDKLSQQADENGKKWWEYQKNITQSTLDWLNVIYQLQDNGLVPLSNQLKQNDTELKTLQSDMNAASNDLKNNINDTQALTKYLSDYHKEVALLNAQNSILNSENEQLQSNNENLRTQMEYINQLHEKGLLTVEAYDAALQSLNNQIEKNNESLAQNTQQITQNVQMMKSAANDIRSMIIDNLKNAYDAEQQYEEQLLQNTFDAQQKSFQNMLDSLTSSLDAQIKALQDQKDAIDKKISDLEQQWSNQDATNKLADLQNQLAQVESQKNQQIIDASGNVTYTYDMQQAVDLQKQITDQETQMKRDAQKQQLQDQANALDAQIKNLQDYEQQQKDYYQKQLQDLQDNYDKQKAKLDAFWQDKLSTDKLNTEADNLILKNGYDDALKNTIDFANKMKEQFASIQSAAIAAGQAVANSLGAMYGSTYTPSSSTGTTTSSGTNTSSSSSGTRSSSGSSSSSVTPNLSNTTSSPDSTHKYAVVVGGQQRYAAALATGGYVPPGKEGFAYLHENEVVINSDLTNRLREVLYNVPKLSVPSVSSHSITQTFHIDKLEFPNVRTAADAEGFAKQIGGIFKQAYFNARAGAMS